MKKNVKDLVILLRSHCSCAWFVLRDEGAIYARGWHTRKGIGGEGVCVFHSHKDEANNYTALIYDKY